MTALGYVVCEVNQASGIYERVVGDLHRTEEDAREEAEWSRSMTAANGRREKYAVAEVHLIDEEAS